MLEVKAEYPRNILFEVLLTGGMKKSAALNQPAAYVAFLRGINVGGQKLIKMSELKAAFESAGFRKAKTLLASGNVLFETAESDAAALTQKIEAQLKKKPGHDIGVILRSIEEIKKTVAANPFAGVKAADCKLYVTFLDRKSSGRFKTPYESALKDFRILSATEREVFCVTMPTAGGRFGDFTKVVEKEFGRKITTRNWNTVLKILGFGISRTKSWNCRWR